MFLCSWLSSISSHPVRMVLYLPWFWKKKLPLMYNAMCVVYRLYCGLFLVSMGNGLPLGLGIIVVCIMLYGFIAFKALLWGTPSPFF